MRQTKRTKLVIASDRPVPYRLTFTASADGRGLSEGATLTSRALDRDMHERGGVGAMFPGVRRRRGAAAAVASATLDPFELASLTHYLQHQEDVRRELERALEHLFTANVGHTRRLWEETKVECVWFAERTLPTPMQLEYFKKEYGRGAAKAVRDTFDTPETRTAFTIFMTPEWAHHQLVVRFRDGACLGLTEEG